MILLRCYPKITDWFWSISGGSLDLRWVPVYSYGFFVASGFMAAAFVITRELQRREQLGRMPALRWRDGVAEWTSELVGDFVIICAIFGIAGASLFNFLESPSSYADVLKNPTFSNIIGSLFSGLSVFGGMICAGIALLIYSWRKKIRIPDLFDCLAYCFILAVGVGRLGCQVSGDGDWGIVNTASKPALIPQFLWSNTYAHNIANEGVGIPGCIEQHCQVLPLPVFPTPMYEFMECFAVFLILHFIRKQLTNRPGMLFFVFAILIGIQRYSIEQIRSISDRELYYIFGHGFKQAEIISVAMVAGGIIGLIWLQSYYQKHPAGLPTPLMSPDPQSDEDRTATAE
jgi:phosphatidylglycerol:prolipoprotein diacylglycerol transferase